MKLITLLSLVLIISSCGKSNTVNGSSVSTSTSTSTTNASTSVMAQYNFKTLSSINSVLKGTWAGYESNGTPIEIVINSASDVTVSRFSAAYKEQIAADQNNYYVLTDTKNSSYWHITNADSENLYLLNANNQSLILTKQ